MVNITDTMTWGDGNYRSNSINLYFEPVKLISFNINYISTKFGKKDKENEYNFGLGIYLPINLSIDSTYQTSKDNKDYTIQGYNTKLLYEISINKNLDLSFGIGYSDIKHNKLYKSKEYKLEELSKDALLNVAFHSTLLSITYTTFDYNKELKKISKIILKRRLRLASILSAFASHTFQIELINSFFDNSLLISVSNLRIRYVLMKEAANSYLVGLDYQISTHFSLNTDYELFYDVNDERSKYYSFGLGYNL
jgi:hypothetical protein